MSFRTPSSTLSLIIPAYNEAAAIQSGKLSRVTDWMRAQAFPIELIVVDDGSQDETARLAQPLVSRVISIAHAGKAAAIVTGMQQAAGEIVLFSDMDQATPITEAGKLLAVLPHTAEIAIGSRGLARPGAPAGRYVLSWGQAILRYALLGLKLTDTQCGFKAMTRAAALEILDHLYLYHPGRARRLQGPSVTSGFDVEFLFVARCLGRRVVEVPVVWNYQETRRVSLVRDAWRGVSDLLAIAFAGLGGRYPKRRGFDRKHPEAG
jgi:glycosyltransferase involved in cell wall biosynthesis